jgi:hypothetical protein
MYDMYPWDSASQGDYPPGPLRSRRDSGPKTQKNPLESSPARAVQVALDRRDNGGDAMTTAGPPATPAATRGAAGRTGQ